jgi:hypothetical protein
MKVSLSLPHLQGPVADAVLYGREVKTLALVATNGLKLKFKTLADIHPEICILRSKQESFLYTPGLQSFPEMIRIIKSVPGTDHSIQGEKPGCPMVGVKLIKPPGVMGKKDIGLMPADETNDFFPQGQGVSTRRESLKGPETGDFCSPLFFFLNPPLRSHRVIGPSQFVLQDSGFFLPDPFSCRPPASLRIIGIIEDIFAFIRERFLLQDSGRSSIPGVKLMVV